MRIAVLGTRGFPNIQGGVETHCQNLYPRLVDLGCEVVVFTRRNYGDKNLNDHKGVKLHALPCVKNKYLETPLHTFLGILYLLRHRPDIVHFQAVGSALLIPMVKAMGLRVVFTTHGSNYRHRKWGIVSRIVLRMAEYLGAKFADEIISISATIAGELAKKYRRNSTIIPNGIEISSILQTDGILREHGLIRSKYVLSVGRLTPDKGFPDLIAAFQMADIDGWKLVIVGQADHPDKFSRRLEQLANQYNNVVLTGFLSGQPLKEIYGHAGLFVMPSYYEGMPLAFLEALSFGLSCIGSDIQAHREMGLTDDRYFDPGDIDTLAKKIKYFSEKSFTADEKRAQIENVASKYNWHEIAGRTLEVYKEVVK